MGISETRTGRSAYTWIALACVVALLLIAGLWTALSGSGDTRVTAYFDRAVGLYPDSTVRVLGIEVGRITDVRPQGAVVRVDMTVDPEIPIPAGARAVVVAPSLVSDRYVQLTPAYESGEQLRSGAVIPRERTATPIELDDLFSSLDGLANALGPNGANKNGALSGALDTIAANLDGNGQNMNDTVNRLADLSRTFEGNKGVLFDTVKHLGEFTTMLARSDRQMNELFDRVVDVTGFLAGESAEVGTALSSLATALSDVRGFVDDNEELLSANVDKLASVTKVLVEQRAAVAEVLDVGPTGLSNFINAYDATSGTIGIRGNLNELTYPPVLMLCRLIAAGTPREVPPTVADACKELAPILDGVVELPTVSEVLAAIGKGEPPPLPLPLAEMMQSGPGAGGGR